MKLSLEKFGRKLTTMHKKDNQSSSTHLDELVQASKDMQGIRNCYDGVISAAAAITNSIFEFSESLHEMGTCLLDKSTIDSDVESGRVLSTLGNIQAELKKIADTYRSYVIVTITNPSESLLSELRKVEEMNLQCDEKREVYEYMMSQHKEKGKFRSGKTETSVAQKLQEAQDEYNEVARLCAFRVKSLKEGQFRSLLTQATRHHAAQQLNFFRMGFKTLEAVHPIIRIAAEKHRIDYQLSKLDSGNGGEGETMSSYESIDDGELSFDYKQKKHGTDNVATSSYPIEVGRLDIPYLHVPTLKDLEINHYKRQEEQHFGRQIQTQTWVSSYSAPLFPEKVDSSEIPKETQTPRKFQSYVLPSPIDAKSPISQTPTPLPQTNPFSKLQKPLPVDREKHEKDFSYDNNSAIQLPAPSHSGFDSKRQAYSGPLPPTKPFSGKIASTSGPNSSTELPLSSPKISELHELPRPPGGLPFSKPVVSSGGVGTTVSRLPPPPLVVPRSFSAHSTNRSPQMTGGRTHELSSPSLTPILLSNMKSTSRTYKGGS